MLAGYVDAYGFIEYSTYVSFMSGNTTQFGSLMGQGHVAMAVPALTAIVFFVVGVFAGTMLMPSDVRRSAGLVYVSVATLLAMIIAATQLRSLDREVDIPMLGLAMGLMNTALSRVGAQSVNVVFVTGTLSAMAQHLALAVRRVPFAEAQASWDTHRRRALLLAGVWASFMTGAALAGAATSRFGVWVLLFPVLVLLALAVYDCFRSNLSVLPVAARRRDS
jgi:uncharacterized membrane protein YoaK (UPF0700 family)